MDFIKGVKTNSPANNSDIETIETYTSTKLPVSYVDLLMITDGFSGEVSNGSFLQIWKSGEVIGLNKSYKIEEFNPGMLVIGSDGAEEAVGIDIRKDSKTLGQYFMVPFESLGWEHAKILGPNFQDIKII